MENLVGRNKELEELKWAMKSDRSELIVLYGRRRVGKTFLVRRFFNDTYTFHFVGAHRLPKKQQLQNFRDALINFSQQNDIPVLTCWSDAFRQLQLFLERTSDNRKVLFFDELPWADSQGSDLMASLEYFWASWVQNRDDVVLIVCGSATSWMKAHFQDNQGGLHNRMTHSIYLRPFYLSECRQYLSSHGFDWDEYQIMQCYMVFGGIPYYLSLLRPYLSLVENIDALCFQQGGELEGEFEELYSALFHHADRYVRVVEVLSEKREGFTRKQLEQATGFSGGGLTLLLQNLQQCDFIVSYAQFGNRSKQTLYRLCDFFTLFYFRFMRNNRTHDEQYWQHHFMDRSVEVWEGFTFEELCLRHLPHLKHGLGISGIATEASAWRYVPASGDERKGAQVDLVIKRVDKLIHLCEMKFSEQPYAITSDYALRLKNRRDLFMEVTGETHGVVLTMVTPRGLTMGQSAAAIHSSITAKDLFYEL